MIEPLLGLGRVKVMLPVIAVEKYIFLLPGLGFIVDKSRVPVVRVGTMNDGVSQLTMKTRLANQVRTESVNFEFS